MIKPINDFVLLKAIEEVQERKMGTIVLEAATSEDSESRLKKFEVIELSDGYINPSTNSERKINPEIKVGSTVIMDKFSGKKLIDDGTEYVLARESEIQAVIK